MNSSTITIPSVLVQPQIQQMQVQVQQQRQPQQQQQQMPAPPPLQVPQLQPAPPVVPSVPPRLTVPPVMIPSAPSPSHSLEATTPLSCKSQKHLGPPEDAFVAVVPPHMPLAVFLKEAGINCLCIERFVNKDLVYFTGEVHLNVKEQLRIRERPAFRREIRRSRVLILSIKGKPTLALEEAKEIVKMSYLSKMMTSIELIAVNPKTFKHRKNSSAASTPKSSVVHAYVQFATEEDAEAMINKVDAMPYKEWFVHSPQCDEHAVFFPNESFNHETHVWKNPEYCAGSSLSPHMKAVTPMSSSTKSPTSSSLSSSCANLSELREFTGTNNSSSSLSLGCTPSPPSSPQHAATVRHKLPLLPATSRTEYEQDLLYSFFN